MGKKSSPSVFQKDFNLNLKHLESGRLLFGHQMALSTIDAYRDQKTQQLVIVTGSWDKTLRIWDGETGIMIKQYQLQEYIASISVF